MTIVDELTFFDEPPPPVLERAASLELREYQHEAIKMLTDSKRAGHQRSLLCMATGGGKTEVAAWIAAHRARLGFERVWFMADRIVLCDQASTRFRKYGVPHGVNRGDAGVSRSADVTVVSHGTWRSRVLGDDHWPRPDLILLDEAHEAAHAVCEWAAMNGVVVWGLTASPFKQELAESFSDLVCPVTTDELIQSGALVPVRSFVADDADTIDTEGVAFDKNTGLYVARDLDARVKVVVGGMVSHYERRAEQIFGNPVEQCMVFAHDIASAQEIAAEFRVHGHIAEYVASSLSNEVNKGRIEAFARGEIQILVNVAILTRGFDHPALRMCLDAFPLRGSKQWWIQKLGRVMRPHPGKGFGVWLDHCFNVPQFADFTRKFFAEGPPGLADLSARIDEDDKPKKEKPNGSGDWVCASTVSEGRQCGYFNSEEQAHCGSCLEPRPDLVCPECGHTHHDPWTRCESCGEGRGSQGRPPGPGTEWVEIEAVHVEGIQFGDGTVLEPENFGQIYHDNKEGLYAELLRWCIDNPSFKRTPAENVAAGKFKSIMGHWPHRKKGIEPADRCSPLVEAEIKRQQLAWRAQQHNDDPPIGQNQCPKCGHWKKPEFVHCWSCR